MKIIDRLRPDFWDHEDIAAEPYKHLFNFRRIWQRAVAVTSAVAVIPLVITMLISYELNRDTVRSEMMLRTTQLVSNSWRYVSLFLSERSAVLDFIAHDNTMETLTHPDRLAAILDNLNERFGGFTDLGVIDNSGVQRIYIGSQGLNHLDYTTQPWFQEVLQRGAWVTEVILGFRREPHLDFAVKRSLPDGSFFVLRAALETGDFNRLLGQFDVGPKGDVFLINHRGVLQTPSRYFGNVLDKIDLPIDAPSPQTKVLDLNHPDNLIVGYTCIPETPFILMIVSHKDGGPKPWYKTLWAFTGFLATSVLLILVVTLTVTTRLVDRMHDADQQRVRALHQVEYTNKMASLGRLAAGIAHEINNPLAIINEKAGHIKDIFTLTATYAKDQKLTGLLDSIIATVLRIGEVTRRLLNFAGHLNVSVQVIDLAEIIHEVDSVLAREAERRNIIVQKDIADDIPKFETDRGKLEQIVLNLFNYAFSSMSAGGQFTVTAEPRGDAVLISFSDNSHGIPPEDLARVFEPFFHSRTGESGTGLGLAITYALVQEIGGEISVESRIGRGTCFRILLPLKAAQALR